MARNLKEERETLAEFETWLRERPDAGFIVGTARSAPEGTGCLIEFINVGCDPMALISSAMALLTLAHEELSEHPFGLNLTRIAAIEQALDGLPCVEVEEAP